RSTQECCFCADSPRHSAIRPIPRTRHRMTGFTQASTASPRWILQLLLLLPKLVFLRVSVAPWWILLLQFSLGHDFSLAEKTARSANRSADGCFTRNQRWQGDADGC
ncbi:MAG TPA: hypothetical protein VMZ25_04070, partial [Terriglobales bacterium]|nr:hypothetical protein [Terriglobales bacterium]